MEFKGRGFREFEQLLERLPGVIHDGAVEGLHEAMHDWMLRARGAAPEDLGFLKAEMKTEIDAALLEGTLLSNAYSRGHNYAYFLHEVGSKRGYQARNGGSLTWLQDTMDMKRSYAIVERHIEEAVKRVM